METVVMVFAGEYDIASKEQLRAELQLLVPVSDLVLDFTQVTYLDSTAVSEMIRMHRLRADHLYERETIVVHNENIQKLFDMLQLHEVFHLVGTLDEALGNGQPAAIRYAFLDGDGRATQPPPVVHLQQSR